MKIKKTWFSYLTWLVLAVFTGVLLAAYLSAFITNTYRTGQYWTAVIIALAFAALAGVWFLGRKGLALLAGRIPRDSHLADMWECFLVMCLFAGAALYRIHLMLHFSGAVESSLFYEMASVKSGGEAVAVVHGASYLYTLVLSFVLSFTGNKVLACVLLQLVFQLAALLVFYFAVRLLAGRVEAVCAMVFLAFSPFISNEMFRITPESFFFLLYAAGLLFLGLYAAKLKGKRGNSAYVLFVLTGIYAGFLGYLDVTGWTLLFFAGFLCVGKAAEEKDGILDGIVRFLVFVLSALVSAFVLFLLDSVLSGAALGGVLYAWWEVYAGGAGTLHFPAGPDPGMVTGMVLCIGAAFAAAGFWFHKEQKQDGWILLLLAVSLLDMAGIGFLHYGIFITAVWSVLAGIGIASMGAEPQEEITAAELVVEEITDGESMDMEITYVKSTDVGITGMETADGEGTDVKIPEAEIPEIRFIENPLPLPKKHVKKEMDFDRNIGEPEMEFDITVEENDDFDIR